MASIFKYFKKPDLTAFEADTQITEFLSVIY